MKLNHVAGAALIGATALAITFGATAARAWTTTAPTPL